MGHSFSIKISSDKTICSLKEAIRDQENIPIEAIVLVFCERVLQNDNSSIKEYGIKDGSTLKLVLQMAGGKFILIPGPGPPTKLKTPIKDEDSVVLLLCKQNEELYMLELHMNNFQQRRAAAAQFFKLAALRPTSSTCQLLSEISGLTKDELYDDQGDAYTTSRPMSSSSSMSTETFLSLIGAPSVSSFNSRPGSSKSYEYDLPDEYYYRSAPMSAQSAREERKPPHGLSLRPATAICLMRLPDIDSLPYFTLPKSRPCTSAVPSRLESELSFQDLIKEFDESDIKQHEPIKAAASKVSFSLDEESAIDEIMLFKSTPLASISRPPTTRQKASEAPKPILKIKKQNSRFELPKTPATKKSGTAKKLKPPTARVLEKRLSNASIGQEKEIQQFKSSFTNTPHETTRPKTQARTSIKQKCNACSKKLGLTSGFKCKCGLVFCSVHRYSDRHTCSFDYKEAGRAALIRENPLMRDDKVLKL